MFDVSLPKILTNGFVLEPRAHKRVCVYLYHFEIPLLTIFRAIFLVSICVQFICHPHHMNYMVYIHSKLQLANEIECIKNELKNALGGKRVLHCHALPCYAMLCDYVIWLARCWTLFIAPFAFDSSKMSSTRNAAFLFYFGLVCFIRSHIIMNIIFDLR